MIKVCHMTSVHDSSDKRILLKECISLAGRGYDVYLAAPGDSFEKDRVNVVGGGLRPSSRVRRMFFFTQKIYKIAEKLDCDIYHIHDPELLSYGLRLKRRGKIVLFDSHEDVPAQIMGKEWLWKPLRNIVSKIYKIYESGVVKKLDAVVAATPYIGKKFENRVRNITVINNYPKLDDIVFQTSDFETRDRIICYAGGISKARGQEVMIKAMENINGKLILAGNYDHKNVERNNKPNVHYLGFVKRKELNELYGKSRLALSLFMPIPNHIDSQPNKIFEYMAAGLPIVMSNFNKWKDLLGKYQVGIYVDPNNIDEIRYAINYLLENPGLAQAMGQNGRNAVVAYFNWEEEDKKLAELYEKLSSNLVK